jgi:hypothetical protein
LLEKLHFVELDREEPLRRREPVPTTDEKLKARVKEARMIGG